MQHVLCLGLSICSRSIKRRGDSPPFFYGDEMKELSVFVDESGDFGAYSNHSPFYLFSLVLHEQENLINDDVEFLNRKIIEHGFPMHAIHTGPIIRNEGFYQQYTPNDRKKLFNDLLLFTNRVNIKYHVINVDKKEVIGTKMLVERLSKQLALFLRDNMGYFMNFDKIIVYYDYGQSEITTILTSVFNSFFNDVEFRHVQPYEYKLFQVADMVCTLELSKLNFEISKISKSELTFYESRRKFRDYYYKTIKKKKI